MTKQPEYSPSKHYKYSPSKLHRILRCPPSAEATDNSEPGEAAVRGTELHHLAATCLLEELDPRDFVPEKDRKEVETFVSFVRAWAEHECPCELIVEETLVSYRIPEFGGTADALVVSGDTIHVFDFKTGREPVSSFDNPQLMAYLVLARERFPDAKKFLATIIQPVVSTRPDTAEYSLGELLDFEFSLLSVLGSNDFAAGAHCKYCPLLANCQTARQFTLDCAAFEPVDGLSTEKCLRILETLTVIQALEKHAKKEMFAKLMRGEEIPGWRLGTSLSNRKWADEAEVIASMKRAKYKVGEFMEQKLISPASMEKLGGRAAKIAAKCAVREENGIVVCEEKSRVARYEPTAIFDEIL